MMAKKAPLILTMLMLIIGLAACSQDGPAENAGEKIDNAAESLGDSIEDATDEATDSVEEAGDEIENATD